MYKTRDTNRRIKKWPKRVAITVLVAVALEFVITFLSIATTGSESQLSMLFIELNAVIFTSIIVLVLIFAILITVAPDWVVRVLLAMLEKEDEELGS